MVDADKHTPGPGRPCSAATHREIMQRLIPRDARRIVLDIGCGKGRCLRGRAAAHPDTWFIGIDRMLSRLRLLAKRAGREGLYNIRLWHCEVHGTFLDWLPADSINECTILFPDPWPKRRHHRRRLITPPFLNVLHRALTPGGHVYLATDDVDYVQWIERAFSRIPAFQPCGPLRLPSDQQTDFEVLFAARDVPIHRLGYQLVGAVPRHFLASPRSDG